MKRFLIFALTMLMALTVAGCIDYDEILELNADGSGTMSMHVVVYKHYFEAIDAMMSSFAPDSSADSTSSTAASTGPFTLITRADIEKRLKERKSSVKLLDFQEKQNDSTATYDMKFSFKNLSEMIAVNEQMGSSDMTGEEEPAPEVSFVQDKAGLWQFSRGFQGASMGEMVAPPQEATDQDVPTGDSTETTDSLTDQIEEVVDSSMEQMGSMMNGMSEMMAKAFGDRKMRLTVKFPGTVTETNATSKSGNTAVWEYKFADLTKAPKQLQATVKKQ
jgi:hypothetical protein